MRIRVRVMQIRPEDVVDILLTEVVRAARAMGCRGVVFIHFDPLNSPSAGDVFFHDINEMQQSGFQGVPLDWQYRIQTYDERSEVIVGVLDIERLVGGTTGEPVSFFRMNIAA